MKRKRMLLVIVVAAVVFISGIALIAPAPNVPRVTLAFLGFSNALPFLGAPEVVRSPRAVFQVTNHTAVKLAYYVEAHASQPGGKGSSETKSGNGLPGFSAGLIMVPTPMDTNGWKFEVIASITRPRPGWQQWVHEMFKQFGTRSVFAGPARTYPQFTNTWTTPPL